MAVNMIHLLATLWTATFSQGKGTLNYQGKVCPADLAHLCLHLGNHDIFISLIGNPARHMINCRLPLFGLGPDCIFSLSSARFFSPYHHDA